MRIAKVLARAGLCSRREAEVWIGAGRIAVNGVALTTPAVTVEPEDRITVDGKPLAERSRTRLFLFHKPRGLVTSARDPEGRPTIFDHLREHWPDGPRVVSVGRLDINSEGLLLLTNDGGLARVLELPSTGWVRRYRVRAKGETSQAVLDGLRHGVTLDGVHYAGSEATLDRVQGANCWLTMALREGKNREIKRVLEHIGLKVNRLIRVSYGPFQLGDLDVGAVKEVPTRVLREQLGPALAKAAGTDFLSPVEPATREARAGADAPKPAEDRARPGQALHSKQPPARSRPGSLSAEPSPRPKRTKPAPGSRKHVSALRAEYGPGKERKRLERSETADRKGRRVGIERLVAATGQESPKKQRKEKAKGKLRAPRGSPSPVKAREGISKRSAAGRDSGTGSTRLPPASGGRASPHAKTGHKRRGKR